MQHWVLYEQLWIRTQKEKQCLITQKQIISMQIEFANTTKLNYYF